MLVPPASTPAAVTLADAKLHLRVDASDEDALIAALIVAATQAAEQEIGRALITQTWTLKLDAFPASAEYIDLFMPPIQSITSITYVDSDGATQTLATPEYTLIADTIRPQVAPVTSWPATKTQPSAVVITYVAGYGAAPSNVPESIRQWALMHVGAMYANRESVAEVSNIAVMPFLSGLLDRYRTYR